MTEQRTRLIAVDGDITQLDVDVIVNAANNRLVGGGGVDGAIHRAAGPKLFAACRKLGGCPTGEARVTPGLGLPARYYVVHVVGSVWNGGRRRGVALLARCYCQSLELAVACEARSIAFSAIGTGVYGYPLGPASEIALSAVGGLLGETDTKIEQVVFPVLEQVFTKSIVRRWLSWVTRRPPVRRLRRFDLTALGGARTLLAHSTCRETDNG